MLKLNHKKLNVWLKSIDLVSIVYELTKQYPKDELYGLTNQIRRAAVSVVSNIAEGASRKSDIERKRFFEISRSSLVELDSQIEISIKLGYIKDNRTDELSEIINHIFAMLSKMISSK